MLTTRGGLAAAGPVAGVFLVVSVMVGAYFLVYILTFIFVFGVVWGLARVLFLNVLRGLGLLSLLILVPVFPAALLMGYLSAQTVYYGPTRCGAQHFHDRPFFTMIGEQIDGAICRPDLDALPETWSQEYEKFKQSALYRAFMQEVSDLAHQVR